MRRCLDWTAIKNALALYSCKFYRASRWMNVDVRTARARRVKELWEQEVWVIPQQKSLVSSLMLDPRRWDSPARRGVQIRWDHPAKTSDIIDAVLAVDAKSRT